jgi:hypothetical protein
MEMDVCEILKIKASPRRWEDILAWAPDPRGLFSVRSAYKLAWDSMHSSHDNVRNEQGTGRQPCHLGHSVGVPCSPEGTLVCMAFGDQFFSYVGEQEET